MMNDVFACSMAKKGSIVINAKPSADIFACSMAKKGSVVVNRAQVDDLVAADTKEKIA